MNGKPLSLACAAVAAAWLLSGCGPSRMYSWGRYETTLYQHYKNPQEKEAHLKRLAKIVKNAEAENKVPPGLYAEYGYALYESGRIPEAVACFEKEKAKWPESSVLMTTMIRNAARVQKAGTGSAAAAGSGTAERPEPAGEKASR